MLSQFDREPATNTDCLDLVDSAYGREPLFYYCRSTTSEASKVYLAIIGDSHADTAYPGFSEELGRKGLETVLFANSGCASYVGGGRGKDLADVEKCQDMIEDIFRVLESLPNIKAVMIVSRGPKAMYARGFGNVDDPNLSPVKYRKYFFEPESYNPVNEFFDAVERTLQYFETRKIPIFYLLENPELGFSPKACVERPFGIFEIKCQIEKREYRSRMEEYRTGIYEITGRYSNVSVLDPEDLFCDEDNCFVVIDGKMMYADDDHLSVNGSAYQAKKFVEQLEN
jgi:hypothetical protein